MNTKNFSEEIMALFESSLPQDRKNDLLAELDKNEILRRQFTSYTIFGEMIKASGKSLTSETNDSPHIDDEILGSFLETGLTSDKDEKAKTHLRTCAVCFQRMAVLQRTFNERRYLHFLKTPVSLIEKAKQLSPTPQDLVNEAKHLPAPRFTSIWEFIADMIEKTKIQLLPRPIWVSAAAIVGIVLLALVLPQSSVKNLSLGGQLKVFSFDHLGFTRNPEVVEYKGMAVELSKDGENLIFTWPPVQYALFYEIYLIENENKRKITPGDGVLENSYFFPKREIKIGVKYIWELAGKMENEKGFLARAEFVCKK